MAAASPRRIIAVGQFPPPLNGFAIISQAVVTALGARLSVDQFNTASLPGRSRRAHQARRLIRLGAAIGWLLKQRSQSPFHLYLPCEGDAGLLLTTWLVRWGRWLDCPVVLHHHSFGYINRPDRRMRRVLEAGGPALRHVFLCEDMARRYAEVYGVPATPPWILSNAAFVPPGSLGPRATHGPTPLVIGHLSNLTREKGLHTFLAVFRAAREQGLDVHAVLAGPAVQTEDQAAIAAVQAEFPEHFRYLGPLTGAAKTDFYQQIDLFLFPTEYANEAQPVVLFEAAAHGNLLVSNLRGCIACQLVGDALRVEQAQDFVPATLRWIAEVLAAPDQLLLRRQRVLDGYREAHRSALRQLQDLAASW